MNRRALKLAAIALALAVVGFFLVRYLQANAQVLRQFEWRFSVPDLVGALVVLTVSILMVAEGWRRGLGALGGQVPRFEAWRVWGIGQTAKYVPGMVWPLAAKVALTRKHGIPAGVVALSGLFEIALTIGGALLLGLLTLPLQAGSWPALETPLVGPFPVWGLGVVLALIGLGVLHPRIFRPLLGLMLRLVRAPDVRVDPGPRRMFGLVAWYILTWGVHGLGMAWFCASAVPGLGVEVWPALAAAYVVAFICGYLVVFLPMGLGVQEAAFAALAGPLFPDPAVAVVVCLGTRAALGVAELLALGVSAGLARGRRS